MERENFRYAQPDQFQEGQPSVASIDVSFISLRLILPPLVPILAPGGTVLMLIKPQFEAGKERVGKKGIVKDPAVHLDVLKEILSYACGLGYRVCDLTFSPITGGEGNIEFLAYLTNDQDLANDSWQQVDLAGVVEAAHTTFE